MLWLGACGGLDVDSGIEQFGTESSTGKEASPTSTTGTMTPASSSTTRVTSTTADVRFDVGMPDVPVDCDAGPQDVFSHVWIANMEAFPATVSKIETVTMHEVGRYVTRPDRRGEPSRTSVNLNGDAAVANRLGGVTMVYARKEDCVDTNGIPGIQTSTGRDDVLDFGLDDCVAWHTPLEFGSNRPVAWAPGVWSEQSCRYEDNKLWTAVTNGGPTAEVLLLDGETGAIEESIPIPEVTTTRGLYGGAVDGDGNFWAIESLGRILVRVDRRDFTHRVWDVPEEGGYGIAVDSQGRPWVCSQVVYRFDPVQESWASADIGTPAWGCMTDGVGTLWLAADSVTGIDTETLEVVRTLELPVAAHGVSVDFHGKVWAVPDLNDAAFRLDPRTGEYETFDGLERAYTYSDMTGFGLSHAGTPAG